jgi:hypothetical protein
VNDRTSTSSAPKCSAQPGKENRPKPGVPYMIERVPDRKMVPEDWVSVAPFSPSVNLPDGAHRWTFEPGALPTPDEP